MLRTIQSFSLDNDVKPTFLPKKKSHYYLKSLIKNRNLRPKSQEADDSNQQIINEKIGPSRRKSCYCNLCGFTSKKQQRFMDLKLIKKPTMIKKPPIHSDRRSTFNLQSANRSVFYRRNTQKKEEKADLPKSPAYDLGESKNTDWYVRQIIKRNSRINVQKFVDNSFSKNSQQKSQSNKINIDDLINVKSQQTIHLPYSTNSPSVRIRTIGAFDQDNTTTSPKCKDFPKFSPYLNFRQLNTNLLAPIKYKSNISMSRKAKKNIFSYSKN
ncbi:unnamed protein product (macronuclear) [Paramecium tetraurelia]|uniref:Uncharacterized protein n=1 Tax=Paramecium tetraurelia TaxID=5888 RepID=A0E761_PARTE|nr:uncharacterized protein GSPATT00023856001 [Paramecium tetraurelia]CAK91128.1 unnamed protein product [Paramecium tetraurelia]|eukprot:XP_001458525.1 hypothetical protein (macronuclear) [Paramecium tetraurelia strain d4-2]